MIALISEANRDSIKNNKINSENGILCSAYDYIIECDENTEEVDELVRALDREHLLDEIILKHIDKLKLSKDVIKDKVKEINEFIIEKIFEYDYAGSIFTTTSINNFHKSVVQEAKNHPDQEKISSLIQKEKEDKVNQLVERLNEIGYDVTLTEKKKK